MSELLKKIAELAASNEQAFSQNDAEKLADFFAKLARDKQEERTAEGLRKRKLNATLEAAANGDREAKARLQLAEGELRRLGIELDAETFTGIGGLKRLDNALSASRASTNQRMAVKALLSKIGMID